MPGPWPGRAWGEQVLPHQLPDSKVPQSFLSPRSTTHHNQAEPQSLLFKLCIGIQPSEEPRMGKDPLPSSPALGYTQQGKW